MELEHSRVPVVTAQDTAATSLGDQDLLHPPATTRHPLDAAPATAVDALRVDYEGSPPMRLALPLDLSKSRGPSGPTSLDTEGGLTGQCPHAQPVADR